MLDYSHPDKLRLAENQTKEEADNIFVELTKAYKSCVTSSSLSASRDRANAPFYYRLTDVDIRHNFEMFGHPDGKQDFSQGIALPAWVVESHNIWWVMGAYALLLGVLLPYVVVRCLRTLRKQEHQLTCFHLQGQWWYGSRKLTKDGVLNTTAAIYFHALKEETPFPALLDILASSDEFVTDLPLLKLRKAIGKAGVDEYARLASTVREADGKQGGWKGFSNWAAGKKRARVLLAAHMLRIPINDATLLRGSSVLLLALPMITHCSFFYRKARYRYSRTPSRHRPRLDCPRAQLALDVHLHPPPPAIRPPSRPPHLFAPSSASSRQRRSRQGCS